MEVSAQQNILDKLETYISDGTLVIKPSNGVHIRSYKDVKVMVSGPEIEPPAGEWLGKYFHK